MKITVTQLGDGVPEDEWSSLVEHAAANQSDLVLVGEMPFSPWLAATDTVDSGAWRQAVETHDEWIERLAELNTAVAGSRPVLHDGVPHNEGFLWTPAIGYTPTHIKHYLPDEPGFWEASWYRPSPQPTFRPGTMGDAKYGFMICTDMWFTEHARAYARAGVDLVVVPRATEGRTVSKWLAGGRSAAVMAGAYCVSSNRQGLCNGVLMGGTGWIIDPDGDVLATTTDTEPFVTLDIDLGQARRAKRTYPRYVAE